MKKACIVIPYYGKWPVYMDFYLKSCENNDFMDFVFVTDLEEPANCPQNVKFIHLTLPEVAARTSRILELQAAIPMPYKLCDFRPAYGLIFAEELAEYAFWGWGDIDLIYGRIDHFITREMLETYDVLSCRRHWVSGAFCLFRNSEEVNNLFRENTDYIAVFEDEKHYSYGECGKKWPLLTEGQNIFEIDYERTNMTLMVREAEKEGRIKAVFTDVLKESTKSGEIVEISDRVTCNGEEFLLYHMVVDKRSAAFRYPTDWEEVPDTYYITKTGFHKNKKAPAMAYRSSVRKINAVPATIRKYLDRAKKKLNKS